MDFRAIWLGTSWTGGRVVGKTSAGVLDCEAARQGEGQQARVNAHAECAGTVEWTGGRVVEGARLESVYTGDRIAGSNPALSAILRRKGSGATAPPYFVKYRAGDENEVRHRAQPREMRRAMRANPALSAMYFRKLFSDSF